jgi:hypothetical protein
MNSDCDYKRRGYGILANDLAQIQKTVEHWGTGPFVQTALKALEVFDVLATRAIEAHEQEHGCDEPAHECWYKRVANQYAEYNTTVKPLKPTQRFINCSCRNQLEMVETLDAMCICGQRWLYSTNLGIYVKVATPVMDAIIDNKCGAVIDVRNWDHYKKNKQHYLYIRPSTDTSSYYVYQEPESKD